MVPGLGQDKGEARGEAQELISSLVRTVEKGNTVSQNPGALAEAVEPSGLACFTTLLDHVASLETIGCAMAWCIARSSEGSQGPLDQKLLDCLVSSDAWHRAGRRRSALPIRVGELAETVTELRCMTLHHVEAATARREFVENCWMFLSFYACNCLVGQRCSPLEGVWSQAEKTAAGSVKTAVDRLLQLDSLKSVNIEEVEKDVKLARVSYSGEEVKACHKLSVEQIVPALPPEGHGGCIDLMKFVSESTRYLLDNPELSVKPDLGEKLPKLQGKIHVETGELDGIAKLLVHRNVCKWIPLDEVFTYRNQKVLNGLFGVPKNSAVKSGKPVLRVIMNLVASNSVMKQFEGSVGNLPAITSWMSTVLDEDEEVRLWQLDMSNAFYLFKLPPSWQRYLSFNVIRKGKALGFSDDRDYALACVVLPMGWLSSVAIMQEISENLLLYDALPAESQVSKRGSLPLWMTGLLKESRKGRRGWWHVYLDNYAGGQLINADETTDFGDFLQACAEEAWKEAQVMSSDKKKTKGVIEAEELGALISGSTKSLGPSGQRLHKVLMATLWTLAQPQLSKKRIQVIAGRWVHILQFRRAGMSFLEATWEYVGSKSFSSGLVLSVRRELWTLACASALLFTNLGAQVDNSVTASDASMTGGAIGIASELAPPGRDWLRFNTIGTSGGAEIPVLVLSLFNGIGGCFRCYDVLGLIPRGCISFETHGPANRVVSRRWPHAELLGDVRLLNAEMVETWLRKYVGISELHCWAGFPCTDLTGIKAFRKNLSGDKSGLFFEVKRILKLLRKTLPRFIKLKFLGENVASMDKAACHQITSEMGVFPYHLNCSDAVPMNRPRLCWSSESLEGCLEGLHFETGPDWTWVTATAEWPLQEDWIEPGVDWPGGQTGAVLPTALRAIIRHQPPPVPAGLSRCDDACRQRWSAEHFKFPPYHYLEKFLFWKEDRWRLCDSSERATFGVRVETYLFVHGSQ